MVKQTDLSHRLHLVYARFIDITPNTHPIFSSVYLKTQVWQE